MKKFTILSKSGFKLMTDGVQIFEGPVVQAMDSIHLWDQIAQSNMKEVDGVKFFISVGYNGRYFKTDGQQYCTHLHIAVEGKCYLHSCFCSWRQNEIDAHVLRMIEKVNQLTNDSNYNFETEFQDKLKNYPWQTSK